MKKVLFGLAFTVALPLLAQQKPVYLDVTKPIEERVEDALKRLTLEEKVAMVHAQSKFSSAGVPRLGIPENWMTDGPHGIRPEVLWDEWDQAGWTNDSCVAYPALTCLAATWNPDMSLLYGKSIGEEARYRNKNVLLGPGVNIYRTPLNGRNFEYMGEDPYLASRMVVPYVQGVQQNGVAACVKHYALNNQEINRHTTNVIVDDRALYEIYLPAFKAAVQEGKTWAIMGAYNLYKGQHACHNQYLLNDILKGEWGFDGVVVSDWGGVHDTDQAIKNGLDMEFGSWTDGLANGSSNAYDNYYLAMPYLERIKSGKVGTNELDDKVRRILRLSFRTTMDMNRPLGSMLSPEHYEAARRIGEEGIVLLQNKGALLPIDLNKAKKIQEHFGSRSVDVIQHSPYLLCEISGFGFKTVDQIARNINFLPADPLRLENGILFILEEAKDSGDLFLMQDILLERAYVLLSETVPKGEVTEAMIKNTLSDLCAYGKLYADGERIYLPQFFHFEEQTAKITAKLLSAKKRHSAKLEQHLKEVQKENGVLLSEKQAEAVRMCMENRFSIITGGPGTGKTTVLKSILAVYQRLHPGKEILLAAPTGRAARKMAESTGFPYASTLHAALKLISDTAEYEEVIIPADFVVVDEASMVDMRLAYYLLHSLGTGTKVLFVGDANQLPSVGAGNVLNEMIASGIVPVTVLDMVFRQKNTSRIPLNAQSIQMGETKLLYGDDFQFLPAENAAEAAEIIKSEFLKQTSIYGVEHTQVLTPFRVKSDAGAAMLNLALQDILNPSADKRPEISSGNRTIRYRDKVMQTKNMETVSNGDIGFVSVVDKDADFPVTVTFSDNRIKEYSMDELGSIDLAYATTIHKSQGSEFDCVIIPVLSTFYVMLQRALIYTAITRAKKKVILVGQKRALFTAVHRNDTIQRNTILSKRIRDMFEKMKQKEQKAVKQEEVEQLTL
jgi:exodeoxyribonuclease V alpha subunit